MASPGSLLHLSENLPLPFDLPAPPTTVAAVSLQSHEPSPLTQQLIAQIRAMARAA